MLNKIIDPPPTLAAYLAARARGASGAELKALKAADEAARDRRTDVIIAFNPSDGGAQG